MVEAAINAHNYKFSVLAGDALSQTLMTQVMRDLRSAYGICAIARILILLFWISILCCTANYCVARALTVRGGFHLLPCNFIISKIYGLDIWPDALGWFCRIAVFFELSRYYQTYTMNVSPK